MLSGLHAKMTNTAAASAVGGSYSWLASSAIMIRPCIMQARTIDGESPATIANKHNTGIPITAVSTRCLAQSIHTNANKMETCIPDTATM